MGYTKIVLSRYIAEHKLLALLARRFPGQSCGTEVSMSTTLETLLAVHAHEWRAAGHLTLLGLTCLASDPTREMDHNDARTFDAGRNRLLCAMTCVV